MTGLKSGSIGRLAAGFAARVATEDPEIVSAAERLGFNLYTYGQLIDDIRDADATGTHGDRARGKKTVPLVCAWDPPSGGRIDRTPGAGKPDRTTGNGIYAALVAEVHLNRAKAELEQLRRRCGSIAYLEQFVESVEASTSNALAHSLGARP